MSNQETCRVGYKYWDEFYQNFKLIEAGVLIGDTFECTNPSILPLGHYNAPDLPWWEVEDETSGFYLID